MKKKILVFALAICVFAASVLGMDTGVDVYAEGNNVEAVGERSGYYEYTILDDGTVEINGYTGNDTELVIPDSLEGRSVTRIGDFAFSDCDSLTSITIPENVTNIGDAFSRGYSLSKIVVNKDNRFYSSESGILYNKEKTQIIFCPYGIVGSIVLSDKLKEISSASFANHPGVTSIVIPDGITDIDNFAFAGCVRLENITLPSSIVSVGEYAFQSCIRLKNIFIPLNVKNIGEAIFDGCYNLDDIYYEGTGTQWNAILIGNNNVHLFAAAVHYNSAGIPSQGNQSQDINDMQNTSAVKEIKDIQLSQTNVTYNGKAQKPSIIAKDGQGNIIGSEYYTTAYSNNKNVGQASVTVTFKGNYTGTVTKQFTIIPKGTTIKKLTPKKNGFTLKWKKQTTQTTGYEIQYSASSKLKGAKTVGNIKIKKTSRDFKKLKGSKKYYVRIRTYKTVKINGKSKKLYSSWSNAKNVMTKK